MKNGVCSVCGNKDSAAVSAPANIVVTASPSSPWHPEVASCPACQAARTKVARFCSLCRFDFQTMAQSKVMAQQAPLPSTPLVAPPVVTPAPVQALRQATVLLQATVEADESLYTVKEPDITFPDPAPQPITVPIEGEVVMLVRVSRKNLVQPQIQAQYCTGVSRQHCQLILAQDGHVQAASGRR